MHRLLGVWPLAALLALALSDSRSLAGALYRLRPGNVAAITAVRVRGARSAALVRAIVPLVFVDMVRPAQARVRISGKRVIAVTDAAMGDNYPQYLYASGDVAWVVEAEEPLLSEIFAALP